MPVSRRDTGAFLEQPFGQRGRPQAQLEEPVIAHDEFVLTELVRANTEAMRIPTTLFKRARQETASAILAGYLTMALYAYVFEGMSAPQATVQCRIGMIKALGCA